MKPYLLILVVLFLSCENKEHSVIHEQVLILQKEDSSLYTGVNTEYYYEGKQKKFVEIYKNGIRDGEYRSWYKNGKVKVVGQFVANKRVGIWKWYTETGELQYTFDYDKLSCSKPF